MSEPGMGANELAALNDLIERRAVACEEAANDLGGDASLCYAAGLAQACRLVLAKIAELPSRAPASSDATKARVFDYEYKAPDLGEWLGSLGGVDEIAAASLSAAFDAGERYGADLERGQIYQSLLEWESEAEDRGEKLAAFARRRLDEQAEREAVR